MALKIVHRLVTVKNGNVPKHSVIKYYDMTEDTEQSRNDALAFMGYANASGKNPQMTNKQFKKYMVDTHAIDMMTVLTLLVDDQTNKAFYLMEVIDEDLYFSIPGRKTKEVRVRDALKQKNGMDTVEIPDDPNDE